MLPTGTPCSATRKTTARRSSSSLTKLPRPSAGETPCSSAESGTHLHRYPSQLPSLRTVHTTECCSMSEEKCIETDIPARLDRLPWSRWHLIVVVALGITWLLDGLESNLSNALAGILKRHETLGDRKSVV